MLLKNKAKRLITINGQLSDKGVRVEKYPILPGNNPAVEVPDNLCKSAFVKALLQTGDLVALATDTTKPDLPGGSNAVKDEYSKMNKADLLSLAGAQGLKIDEDNTKAQIADALRAVTLTDTTKSELE